MLDSHENHSETKNHYSVFINLGLLGCVLLLSMTLKMDLITIKPTLIDVTQSTPRYRPVLGEYSEPLHKEEGRPRALASE